MKLDVIILLLSLIGHGLIVSAIYVLAGPGWSLLAAGIACYGLVRLLLRGAQFLKEKASRGP